MHRNHTLEAQRTQAKTLSETQRRGLEAIRAHIALTGRAPSCTELATIMGYQSRTGGQHLLHALERDGAIEIVHGVRYGIRIPGEHEPAGRTRGPHHEPGTPLPPSPRQAQVLDFIRTFHRRHGKAPTYREIARALAMAGGKANSRTEINIRPHVRALVRKGWIRHTGQHRGIALVEPEERPVIEIGETLAPDEPVFAERRIIDRVPGMLCERFDPRPDYFIKITKAAMPTLGVEPGDLIAIGQSSCADDGALVIARVGQEVRFGEVRTSDAACIKLAPLAGGKPTSVEADDTNFRIEGIVLGSVLGRALARRGASA